MHVEGLRERLSGRHGGRRMEKLGKHVLRVGCVINNRVERIISGIELENGRDPGHFVEMMF